MIPGVVLISSININVRVLMYKKMSESNSTTVETNKGELRYYEQLEKHINSLGPKFREKSVMKQYIYKEIIRCLLLLKGKVL